METPKPKIPEHLEPLRPVGEFAYQWGVMVVAQTWRRQRLWKFNGKIMLPRR